MNDEITARKLSEFDSFVANEDTILIDMHDYPDPDALTSALILSYLVENRYALYSEIAYRGDRT